MELERVENGEANNRDYLLLDVNSPSQVNGRAYLTMKEKIGIVALVASVATGLLIADCICLARQDCSMGCGAFAVTSFILSIGPGFIYPCMVISEKDECGRPFIAPTIFITALGIANLFLSLRVHNMDCWD